MPLGSGKQVASSKDLPRSLKQRILEEFCARSLNANQLLWGIGSAAFQQCLLDGAAWWSSSDGKGEVMLARSTPDTNWRAAG